MNKRGLLLIAGIVLFYIVNNFIWLSLNKYPCEGDEPAHLYMTLYYRNLILHPFPNFEGRLYKILEWQWPPFHHIFSALISFIFGVSYLKLIMINIIYLVMLLVGVYFISKKIYNQKAAIFSVFLISFYPFIYGYSRIFMLAFPLTAIVALSISLLLYTERFSNRKFSILFGISMGVGLVIKWSYIIFITGPLLYVILQGIYEGIKGRKKLSQLVINLLLAGCLAFIISAPWYLGSNGRHLKQIFSFWHIANVIPQDEIKSHSVSFWESRYLWYLVSLINHQVSFVYFIIFILTLPFFLMRKDFKDEVTLILWIILPYLFFSNVSFKVQRFIMPLLPAIACISGAVIACIKPVKFRKMVFAFLIVIGIVQYFLLSYTHIFMRGNLTFPAPFHYINVFPAPVVVDIYEEGVLITSCGPPLREDWKLRDILETIRRYYQENSYPPVFAGVISEMTIFYRNTLLKYGNAIYFNDFNHDFRFFNISPYIAPREVKAFFRNINAFNVILFVSRENDYPNPERIVEGLYLQPGEKRMLAEFIDKVKHNYQLFTQIPLPKGFRASIFVKKIPKLEKGGWRIFLYNGVLKLNYRDSSLTKGEGLFFSCLTDKKDYRGEESIWILKAHNENCLTLEGKFPESKFSQLWEVRIREDDKVEIKTYVDVFSLLNVKRILSGIFLADNYKTGYKPVSGESFSFKNQWIGLDSPVVKIVEDDNTRFLRLRFISNDIVSGKGILGELEYYNFAGWDTGSVALSSGRYKVLDIIIEVGELEEEINTEKY